MPPGEARMTQIVITITPVQGGWAVESPYFDVPLLFLSRARAQAQAEKFSKLAMTLGCDVEILSEQPGPADYRDN
jgi:hypothetical protein